ncbi:Predicted P-loop ATPase and inactivated derivatives [Noviherbaspirillum humi]|uniref:Predicted P-loop ATPase and inactivated derivatives n=1 Tax=Noviherbaspirillum humi TaxID=1688639 RepID=A0A239LDP2_9BURK|nr:VapE domain-containing protein [Noviherbaspirillum humi]SNT28757.1 Predicted P-loop ATPase and inactivated derivatives [Noviherbaspirillum humi]
MTTPDAIIDIALVPASLRRRCQWLLWRFEPGDKKPKKMPYYSSGNRRVGKQGDEADRAALVTLDQALQVVQASNGRYSGVGFAFLPGDGLIGIDIDGCIKRETGEITEMAQKIIDACASYTEYSPSGTGVHIIVAGESDTFKSNEIGLEVFCGRQYFTFTAKPYMGCSSEIAPISATVLNRLRITVKGAKHVARTAAAPMVGPVDERAKLESALAVIPADCGYDEWIRVGMGIYDALGEAGLGVWDYWSSKASKYGGLKDLESHWKSFGGGSITAATVYKMAVDRGWRPPKPAREKPVPALKAASTPVPAGAVAPGPHDEDEKTWRDGLIVKPRGGLEDCRENVYIVLMNDDQLKGLIALNEFSQLQVKRRVPPWGGEVGEWTEADDFKLGHYLVDHYNILIKSDGAIEKAVAQAARENQFNPVVEYLRSLEWDGEPRLHLWLTEAMGAEPTRYNALIGTLFLMSMVARAFHPGCQMDYMPVFEGGQGAGKSSALRVLGGDWYSETPFKIGDKDAYLAIQGVWLYEIAELDSFNKADSTSIKAFITNKTDRFRAPYGRRMLNVLRRTCFAATTNQDEYLKDSTGNRRSWPVRCGMIQLERLAEMRDQLFAEAVNLIDQGHKWHPTREEQRELIEPEQEARELADPWEPRIQRYVDGQPLYLGGTPPAGGAINEVTSEELLTKALEIEIGKISGAKTETMRIASVMKRLGWEKKRQPSGRREWYYARPKELPVAPAEQGVEDDLPI